MIPFSALPPGLIEAIEEAAGIAIACVAANERKQFEQDRKLFEAQTQATIEQLRTVAVQANAAMAELRNATSMRLAELHDGADGIDGADGLDGEPGEKGEKGDVGPQGEKGQAGPQGEKGEAGAAGPQGATGSIGLAGAKGEKGDAGEKGEAGVRGATGPAGRDGAPGKIGERGPSGHDGLSIIGPEGEPGPRGERGERGELGPRGMTGKDGSPGPRGERGDRGEQGLPGVIGKDGAAGPKGDRGERGDRGEQGPQGPPGRMVPVKQWQPGVIAYAGELVTNAGATWQAQRDSSHVPAEHSDWALIAAAGQDARTPTVRGTYEADGTYAALDIVALNGGSFIAKKDHPGECPGEGWQMIARQGQRGIAGEKGERGAQGPQGVPGVGIRGWKIDREAYVAVPMLTDGTVGPALELRSLFEQFQVETG